MFLSLSLSLSLSFLCVCGYCENKIYFTTKARKVSFFSRVVCEEDEPTTCVLDKKRKEKKDTNPSVSERDSRDFFADRLSQTAEQEKRHTCSEIFVKKAKQKISHISLFSLSLSKESFGCLCVAFGRYESYSIKSLSSRGELSRREKKRDGKASIPRTIASSSNRFPRFRRRVLRVRVRVRERARLDLPFFAAA